jgi:hypothetical protein
MSPAEFPYRLVDPADAVNKALGIKFHIAPDTAVAPVARAYYCVVHVILIGHVAEERMPKHMVAP